MRIDGRYGREPAAIGNTEDPDPAIVLWHVLQQPVNGVVSVAAFVNRLGVFLVARRTIHHELPLRSVTAANVLLHKDVTIVDQLAVASIDSVGIGSRDSVGRSA